jgi:hypothetical protein
MIFCFSPYCQAKNPLLPGEFSAPGTPEKISVYPRKSAAISFHS